MQVNLVASLCLRLMLPPVCPSVWRTDRGTYVVQGYKLSDEDKKSIKFASNEDAVEIPAELVDQLAKAAQTGVKA